MYIVILPSTRTVTPMARQIDSVADFMKIIAYIKPSKTIYLLIMTESFELIEHFNVTPDVIYNAWLDSNQHSAMTGGEAKCSDKVDDEFTAWDGYITGKNIALTPNEEIVQKWRTVEFESHHEDSDLVVELEPDNGGTKLTLIHMHIPEGQTQYKQGWIDNYFEPMKAYFG